MTIGEFCNRDCVYTIRDSTVAEGARLMREHHVGDLIVVDDQGGRRFPVGILTDRDLVVEILASGVDMNKVTVGDIMSPELVTARETDPVYDTMQRMRAKGVRRMPVVDAEGALAGIVTVDDFLDLLAEELTALARLVSREQAQERHRRR